MLSNTKKISSKWKCQKKNLHIEGDGKEMKTESSWKVWWMVMDGQSLLTTQWVNYDRTERLLLKETPLIHWGIDSVRIFWSTTTLPRCRSLAALHTFLATFQLCSGTSSRPSPLYPLLIHTHISCLAPSFPLRHLTIVATITVSLTLFVITRSFHTLASRCHLSISLCPPSHSSCGPAKCMCPFLRIDCQILNLQATYRHIMHNHSLSTLSSYPRSAKLCCVCRCPYKK